MTVKTYMTTMPNKSGAFLLASRIISKQGGNIVRVSYNKAVDMHALFLDIRAEQNAHEAIERELKAVGYLNESASDARVVMVELAIPDVPGAVLPALKVLDRYDINISYINSEENDTNVQHFQMGLLIENPEVIKMLLDDLGELYPIDILEYDDAKIPLDNTIFYIRLASEMRTLFDLVPAETQAFIAEANRVLQLLQKSGENPGKVFEYIRRFAHFIADHRGRAFQPKIERIHLSSKVTLHSIQPPCGSNTYVLETDNELVLIDTGYARFWPEMREIFHTLFDDFENRLSRIYITHPDVDHCGLLSILPAPIHINEKSARFFRRQRQGQPDYREAKGFCYGYTKLNRIISGYAPPPEEKMVLMDQNTPEEHEELYHLGSFVLGDLIFDVLEGNGGHVYGEMIFWERKGRAIFTGDNLVNIQGFSPEQAEFNALAPYLMTSVNVDSFKATAIRKELITRIAALEIRTGKPCLICGGHGPLSFLKEGKLVKLG